MLALVAHVSDKQPNAIVELLTAAGYSVLAARDAHALVDLFEAHRDAQVIVSDLDGPASRALDAIDAVRRLDAGVSVIVVTASSDDCELERAYRLGAAVFSKPLDLGELQALVQDIARA